MPDATEGERPRYNRSVFRYALLLFVAMALAGESETLVVWNAAGANVLGAPTMDGRQVTCVEPGSGNLAVVETATGKLRRLTNNVAGTKEFAYFSAPSRDGTRVAYAWFNEAGFYDLCVVPMAGGDPRVLFHNEEAGFVQPSSWTPDGKQILTLFFRKDNISQIALVDAENGAVRVLKSLNWVYPKRMEISPDGRWIAYDSFSGDKPGPRDIFVLAMDGSRACEARQAAGGHTGCVSRATSPAVRRVPACADSSGPVAA